MNVKIDDFTIRDSVCSFGNLYKAMYKCRRNVLWKDSVAGFLKNGLVNVYKLKQSLYNGTYQIDPYTMFKVYEPKERDIVSTRIKDRVYQRSLCDNYLYDTVTHSFIRENCACQINKGTHDARDLFAEKIRRHYRKYGTTGGMLKCDVKDFFGSTLHSVAIQAIDCHVDDDWAVGEVSKVIRSFNPGTGKGMGLGSEITQITELAVLDKLDHFIKEQLHIKGYIRYMDDFILIHPDMEYLKECRERVREYLENLGLKLSPKKTQLFPVTQPVRFLGFSFRLTETGKVVIKILPEKVSHERRKLKKLVQRSKEGFKSREEVNQCYESWKSHASYGDNHSVILKMDQFYKNLWR